MENSVQAECVSYFKNAPGFNRTMQALWDKWRSYGRLAGEIWLQDPSPEEIRTLQTNFHADDHAIWHNETELESGSGDPDENEPGAAEGDLDDDAEPGLASEQDLPEDEEDEGEPVFAVRAEVGPVDGAAQGHRGHLDARLLADLADHARGGVLAWLHVPAEAVVFAELLVGLP